MMARLELQPLAASQLYNRRLLFQAQDVRENGSDLLTLDEAKCARCCEGLRADSPFMRAGTDTWHPACFLCAQCFRPFPDGVFFDVGGRNYCQNDFHVLYAPSCSLCREFIIGRVIRAMNSNWHVSCFRCEMCDAELAESGFVTNNGRALCRPCNSREKAASIGKYICFKCHGLIEEGGYIKYKLEIYHPYHFNCIQCKVELDLDAREMGGELYCLKCHDRQSVTCAACKRPIEGARTVHALGKQWHHEHFVCAHCEKPFLGTRFYEKRAKAYCQNDFHMLFGNCCHKCGVFITVDSLEVFSKFWCRTCFSCTLCDKHMNEKSKFYEFDAKPVCKKCYERFPKELKKRLTAKKPTRS